MNKKPLSIFLSIIIFTIILSGCTENKEDNNQENIPLEEYDTNDNPETFEMNVYEYGEDQIFDYDIYSYFTLEQLSLEPGDTVILTDNISSITYDSENDTTKINICSYVEKDGGGQQGHCHDFKFIGDLTSEYDEYDSVSITVTMKRVRFSDDGFIYDLEIFAEQWVDDIYFNDRVDQFISFTDGLKPMSADLIIKN